MKSTLARTNVFTALENLEPRQLMSGNVLAAVVDGNLVVSGDAAANDIVLTAGTNPGEVLIYSGTSATKVNGQTTPQLFAGVTGNVGLAMHQGNDKVQISALDVAGNLNVDLGVGSDTLTIDNGSGFFPPLSLASIGGNFNVVDPGGVSTVSLTNVAITGSAAFSNILSAGNVTADTVTIGKYLTVWGGIGHDTASFANSTIGKAANFMGIDVSLNNDTLSGMLLVTCGLVDGNVSIVNTHVVKGVSILSGDGADALVVSGSTFDAGFNAGLGLGNDTATIDGSTFNGNFTLALGLGDDTASIATTGNVVFNQAAGVFCMAGNDALTIGSSANSTFALFSTYTTLYGGPDTDTLTYLSNNNSFPLAPAPDISGFETIQ